MKVKVGDLVKFYCGSNNPGPMARVLYIPSKEDREKYSVTFWGPDVVLLVEADGVVRASSAENLIILKDREFPRFKMPEHGDEVLCSVGRFEDGYWEKVKFGRLRSYNGHMVCSLKGSRDHTDFFNRVRLIPLAQ